MDQYKSCTAPETGPLTTGHCSVQGADLSMFRGNSEHMHDHTDTATDLDIGFGDTVYDEAGNPLGTIRGLDDHGFHVTFDDGIGALSIAHLRSGLPGEAELMWRCLNCGEMGDLEDELPASCPNCDAARESLYYWTED